VPAQVMLEPGQNRLSFFVAVAGLQHVKNIERTPIATPSETPTPTIRSGKGDPLGSKSEGVAYTGADAWQAAGITGKGVKVGVIDQAFNSYKQFLGNAKVTTKSFRSDGQIEDSSSKDFIHGTACAEIVNEMAPDAEIYLAAFETPNEYIAAIRWLSLTVGVSAISSSISFPGQYAPDDTNRLSQEIDRAKAAGVFFATSAGNQANGLIGTDTFQGHFGAKFTDADKDGFHDFPGAKNKNGLIMRVANVPFQLVLNWDDWKQPHVNYDLLLYDKNGKEVGRSDDNQATGRKMPVEEIDGKLSAGDYIVKVKKVNANDPDLPFNLFFKEAFLEQVTPMNSLSTPSDAKGAITVAAVDVKTGKVESFSSQGPTLDGRKKPDVSAPDDTSSFAFASIGNATFFGTSAATPHTAGAAALYKQAFPDATPDATLRFFADHAKKPQGTPSGDNVTGVGLLFLDAVPANASTRPAPTRPTTTAVAATPVATRATTTQATSSPSGGVIFMDTFTSPTTGLPSQGYQNGAYRVHGDAGSIVAFAYPNTVANVAAETYEVQARTVSGAADAVMGLQVRRLDADNYLLFVITNDGAFAVFARVNGSLRAIGTGGTSAAIMANTPNTLQVAITGTQFAFTVNGQVLTRFDITDIWTHGAFGLVAGGGNNDAADVAFTNYRVTVK
ncbi:MAG: S8 family serine peptidase, partial [Thermomicrobiales bacterium]